MAKAAKKVAPETQAGSLAIEWTERRVNVADLVPFEKNPRRIGAVEYGKLLESLRNTGYHSRILATPDLRVASGHQRIQALKELGIAEVAVLVPNRELTDQEYKRVLISSNISAGEFDYDALANEFEFDDLVEWGFSEEQLLGLWPEDSTAEGAGGGVMKMKRPSHKSRLLAFVATCGFSGSTIVYFAETQRFWPM